MEGFVMNCTTVYFFVAAEAYNLAECRFHSDTHSLCCFWNTVHRVPATPLSRTSLNTSA